MHEGSHLPVFRNVASAVVLHCTLMCGTLAAQPTAGGTQNAPAADMYEGRSVAQWAADLGDRDTPGSDDRRRRAAYALGRIGPAAKAAVPALLEVVNDPNMEPRWYAVDALGRIGGDAKVAQALADAVRNPENDVYVRRNAVKSLGRLGEASKAQTGVLEEQLAGDDAPTRAAAAVALWRIDQGGVSMEALRSMLASHSADDAFQACLALEKLGGAARPAIDDLVPLLGSANNDVRRAAAKTLGGLGIEAARAVGKAVDSGSANIDGAAAATALGFIVERVREQVLYRPETPTPAFDQAVRALLAEVQPPLVALLASPDEAVRRQAGRALAQFGMLAVPALLRALESDNEAVRASAAEALVRVERHLPVGTPPPNVAGLKKHLVPPLIEAMRSDWFDVRYGAIRVAAAISLGSEAAEMKPLLNEALEDEDAGIRRYAAQALADIRRTE